MESTSAAILSAERVFVPLKTMCSMKWLIPLTFSASWRLPRLSQTPTATLRAPGMDSVRRVRPFGRLSLTIMRGSAGLPARESRLAHARLAPGDPVKDEHYQRWVRLNLPHARTVAQRIGRSLEALDAFGEKGNGHAGALAEAYDALERRLRGFDEDPPA